MRCLLFANLHWYVIATRNFEYSFIPNYFILNTGAYPGSKLYSVGGLSNAQPGDIVFRSGHVALYVAPNTIVHAVGTKHGVKQTTISGGWFGTVGNVYRVRN